MHFCKLKNVNCTVTKNNRGYFLRNKIIDLNTLKKKKLWRRIDPKTESKKDKPGNKICIQYSHLHNFHEIFFTLTPLRSDQYYHKMCFNYWLDYCAPSDNVHKANKE